MESEFYLQARREWDERYGDLVLGKRNWQIASAGLMLLSLALALGIVWMSARSKGIPYIVEVDKRATGVEPATSSLGRAPTRGRQGSPRIKILELQGFSNFRLPASDFDFDRSPGNFDRNLPENLLISSPP